MSSIDSFGAKATISVNGREHEMYRLDAVPGLERLPYSLKILAENLLRHEDGANVTRAQIEALAAWDPDAPQADTEIQFTPARVIMQDFTGVPCVVDLATMREAVVELGGDPNKINPLAPAELVIDHSVQIDFAGCADAPARNVELEYRRNRERYQFLRWGQTAFDGFKVVPPGTGIVHQVNIEHLARVVMEAANAGHGSTPGSAPSLLYPDTCVGTDSHTTMVNGLGVLGWGVGGIEAEAAMLGQPVSMLIPPVVGFRLTGKARPGVTATDVVLTITERLREHGVVGKFVEFYGDGVAAVPAANRATIGNMSPEFGSTAAIFPIDDVTLDYLRLTGRPEAHVAVVEAYAKAQGLWRYDSSTLRQAQGSPDSPGSDAEPPAYSEYVELDLGEVVPSIAGPRRPQDRIALSEAAEAFRAIAPASNPTPLTLTTSAGLEHGTPAEPDTPGVSAVSERPSDTITLDHGHVVIASITSCTNTSNPQVMMSAGLLARNAVARGLTSKPWVKTSMAPGSQVVTGYYEKAGLWPALDALGFNLVGYGCATCIGNSGPLAPEISQAIHDGDLSVAAVLSGNRNFEGRINPDVKLNYLASPPLVIAYALAGTMDFDFDTQPLGIDPATGVEIFLRDIWPSSDETEAAIAASINRELFEADYADVYAGDANWQALEVPSGSTFAWDPSSTYVRKPPYFEGLTQTPVPITDIRAARVLALLGDSVTTDHISPAGAIKPDSPAGRYLADAGVSPRDFNSYGSRRGNHEVMIRGTFANIRLRNLMLATENDGAGIEGGFTRNHLTGSVEAIYDAATAYRAAGTPLVVLAGKEYGSGSSRDWAAKGTALLGVRAVIAESDERIHRSNLIGMGVLPLQFPDGENAKSLGLTGTETFDIVGIEALNLTPDGVTPPIPTAVTVTATADDGHFTTFDATVRIDTPGEADYYRHGGILQYVLRSLVVPDNTSETT